MKDKPFARLPVNNILTYYPLNFFRYNLLTHDKGESLLLNLLLPLCLKVGSGHKDAPKMRVSDVRFALNLLLNLLNPSYFRAAASGGVSGGKGGASSHHTQAAAAATAAAVQYNPSGSGGVDSRSKLKPTSLEIAFLGLKILIVCFEAQLHGEWFRIARTVREMGNRHVEQVRKTKMHMIDLLCIID